MLVIDKPPVTGGKPPELPPFLRKKGGPERRTLILPDIRFMMSNDGHHTLYDHQNNWKTTVYHHMNRIIGESMWDPSATWEITHSSTRQYRQWLETYHYPSGIPPHIQFGGAIKAGEPDPTFYPRWMEWARETFF